MKQMTIMCGACGTTQHIAADHVAFTCTECQASSRYMENARTWVWDTEAANRPPAKRGAIWWLTVVLFVVGIVAVLALLGVW